MGRKLLTPLTGRPRGNPNDKTRTSIFVTLFGASTLSSSRRDSTSASPRLPLYRRDPVERVHIYKENKAGVKCNIESKYELGDQAYHMSELAVHKLTSITRVSS